jgi:hypothetical protein
MKKKTIFIIIGIAVAGVIAIKKKTAIVSWFKKITGKA